MFSIFWCVSKYVLVWFYNQYGVVKNQTQSSNHLQVYIYIHICISNNSKMLKTQNLYISNFCFVFTNKFFKIQCVKEAIKKLENNEKAAEKLRSLEDRIVKEDQLNSEDLPELIAKFSGLIAMPKTKKQPQQSIIKNNDQQSQTPINNQAKQAKTENKINRSFVQVKEKAVASETSLMEDSGNNNNAGKVNPIDLKLFNSLVDLYSKKKYAELVGLFEKNLVDLTTRQEIITNKKRVNIADSILSLVTSSLLQMVCFLNIRIFLNIIKLEMNN